MVVSIKLGEGRIALPTRSNESLECYCYVYANSVYIMWPANEITVEIVEADGSVVIVDIATPVGTLTLIGSGSIDGHILRMDRVHVQGLESGTLGRSGLNAIGRKLLELADVDQIIVQGGARTTGRGKGKIPRTIRFPRQTHAGT